MRFSNKKIKTPEPCKGDIIFISKFFILPLQGKLSRFYFSLRGCYPRLGYLSPSGNPVKLII